MCLVAHFFFSDFFFSSQTFERETKFSLSDKTQFKDLFVRANFLFFFHTFTTFQESFVYFQEVTNLQNVIARIRSFFKRAGIKLASCAERVTSP